MRLRLDQGTSYKAKSIFQVRDAGKVHKGYSPTRKGWSQNGLALMNLNREWERESRVKDVF